MTKFLVGHVPMILLLILNVVLFLSGIVRSVKIVTGQKKTASAGLLFLNGVTIIASVALSLYLLSVWNKPVFKADLFRYFGMIFLIFVNEVILIFLDDSEADEAPDVEIPEKNTEELRKVKIRFNEKKEKTGPASVCASEASASIEVEAVSEDSIRQDKEVDARIKKGSFAVPDVVPKKEKNLKDTPIKVLYIVTNKEQFNVSLFQKIAYTCSCIPFQIGYVVPDVPANVLQGVIINPSMDEKASIVEEEVKTQLANNMKVYTKPLMLSNRLVELLKVQKQVNITQIEPLCDRRSYKRLVRAFQAYELDVDEVRRLLQDFQK